MRVAIREQFAALVIFAVLISLAVISIPTWIFVNRFVVDIESKGMALTASLKAAQINSELELLQTSLQTVATRRTIQDALSAFYENTGPFSVHPELDCNIGSQAVWCLVRNDVGRALSTSKYTNLLQARIYLNNSYEQFDDGVVLNLSSDQAIELFSAENRPEGQVLVSEDDVTYPPSLFPNMTYIDDEVTAEEAVGNTTKELKYTTKVAAPFPDLKINTFGGLVLGPMVFNETFSLISLTGPIYDNGTESNILGYLTLVATAKSLINIQTSSEGLDDSGVVLIVGPSTKFNRFPKDNPATTDEVQGDRGKLGRFNMRFILPPITPKNGDERHSERKYLDGIYNDRNFSLSEYPAALNAFSESNKLVNNASSILSTVNEQGYPVAVGYARPQTPLVNWTVIVEKSRQEAYIPVETLRHILLGCVFGTAGLSLLLVYPVAHRFVMPIRKLKSATEKSIAPPGYSDGCDSFDYEEAGPGSGTSHSHRSRRHFFTPFKTTRRKSRRSSVADDDHDSRRQIFKIPARVDDRRHLIKDELTELTATFNEMSDELYKQYTLLDEKVAERTRELEISKKAAEAANESKTLFIANISHELKTPLNGILGMTSICLDETDLGKIQESLKTIYKSGDLLLHLLTDLLNFSKNQIGQQLSLEQKEFRLNDIKQQIMVIFDKQVREGEIDFNVRFLRTDSDSTQNLEPPGSSAPPAIGPPGTGRLKDMCLWGDQHRILQVIINLVSNSLKFTPRGGKVDCRIKCLGEVGSHGDISRASSTSKKGRGSKPRHRLGSASNHSGGTGTVDSNQFPVKEGTAVVINPVEPKVAPPVAPVRERSPSPPPRDAKTYLFEFEVQDSGPGIAGHMQQKVFEPFVQGDLGLSRKHGGTGLGLSICQQLATLMGGTISLSSTVGVGTTFTVRIPLRYIRDRPPSAASTRPPSLHSLQSVERVPSSQTVAASPARPPGEKTPANVLSTKPRLVGLSQPSLTTLNPSPASVKDDPIEQATGQKFCRAGITGADGDLGKLRVLVAEDNVTNIKVMSGFLEKERTVNCVVFARNGREAYDRVKESEEPFDLILMDIQMPLIDGLQSASLIRKAGYQVPIVALSAFSDESNVRQCLRVGMNDFIEKPLKRRTLKAILKRFAPILDEDDLAAARRPGAVRRITEEDKVPGTMVNKVDATIESASSSTPGVVVKGRGDEVQTPDNGRTSSHSSRTTMTPSENSSADRTATSHPTTPTRECPPTVASFIASG